MSAHAHLNSTARPFAAPEPAHLFVYGTLLGAVGHPMAGLLARHADYVGPARVTGRLYDVGDYPGLVLAGAGDGAGQVLGELYRLRTPAATLRQLDTYEGCAPSDPPPCEFVRVVATASAAEGPPVPVWVYVYGRATTALPLIPSGDYLQHLAARQK